MFTRTKSVPAPRVPAAALATATFECSSCGATNHSADAILPVGWTARAGSAWCVDCTRAGIPVRILRERKVAA
jgi:hypothetical protein